MKAVRIHEHGGPEVLRYEDAPEPAPRANEVLIKVGACSLNHLDLWIRGGLPGLKLDMPHVLGSDAAGEVVEADEMKESHGIYYGCIRYKEDLPGSWTFA